MTGKRSTPRRCYLWWDYNRKVEGKLAERLVDRGLFVVNPARLPDDPPASMYFDKQELAAHLKTHPKAKMWTVVDGGNNREYLMEGYHFVNRIDHLVESTVPEGHRHDR